MTEKTRQRAKENPELFRKWKRDYAERNHASVIKRAREWELAHPERRKLNKRATQNRRRVRLLGVENTLSAAEIQAQHDVQNGKCYWCGRDDRKMHTDHVVPISRGGSNTAGNIVIACYKCNIRKHDNIWRRNPDGSVFVEPR